MKLLTLKVIPHGKPCGIPPNCTKDLLVSSATNDPEKAEGVTYRPGKLLRCPRPTVQDDASPTAQPL